MLLLLNRGDFMKPVYSVLYQMIAFLDGGTIDCLRLIPHRFAHRIKKDLRRRLEPV